MACGIQELQQRPFQMESFACHGSLVNLLFFGSPGQDWPLLYLNERVFIWVKILQSMGKTGIDGIGHFGFMD